jgi:hypothetical protein
MRIASSIAVRLCAGGAFVCRWCVYVYMLVLKFFASGWVEKFIELFAWYIFLKSLRQTIDLPASESANLRADSIRQKYTLSQ